MTVSYLDFLRRVGITPEPGQRVACAVAFDGVDPADLVGEDRELARLIFGAAERFTPQQRRIFAAVCGGRAGKTRLFSAMRLLHLGLTLDLSRLAPGEPGYCMIVGPKVTHAEQVLGYVKGAIDEVPALRDAVVSRTKREVVLRRKDKLVSFLCTGASVRGDAQRGKSLLGFAMDEAAFFRDEETGAVNDVDLFQAMMPRLIPEGQAIVPSTPWTKAGLLWDFYERNHGHPVDAIVAHAPTLTLRSDAKIREQVELARIQDEANARRELDAVFVDLDTSRFFDQASVDTCIGDYAQAETGDEATAGADFGFVKNSSAVVVGVWRGGTYHVLAVEEQRPRDGAPLRPSETIASLGRIVAAHGCDVVLADGHYREAVREHLEPTGVYLRSAPEGSDGKAKAYAKLRALLREGRLVLPPHDRLIRQVREVEVRYLAGERLSISSPVWADGAHGDLVAALVLAVWQDHGTEVQAARRTPAQEREDDILDSLLASGSDDWRR